MGMFRNGVLSKATIRHVYNGINDGIMRIGCKGLSKGFMHICGLGSWGIFSITGNSERLIVMENGRNTDILSAYSLNKGITLAM